MKKYFVIIAALAMTVSCTEKMSEELNYSSEQMTQEVTVKVAPFIGQDTKSTIDTSANFAWASGDKFGVYPLKTSIGAEQTSQQVMFQIHESSVGTNKGLFTGTGWGLVTGGSYKYFAYYPYDKDAEYNKVDVTYACNYTVSANSSTAHITEDYLVAPVVTPTQPTDASFTFYHMGALVNFKLNIPEGDRSATFNYAEISCEDAVFATEGYYDPTGMTVTGESATVTYPVFTATSPTKKIYANLSNIAPDSEGNLNVYMMLPPTALNGKSLKAVVLGNNSKSYSATKTMGGNLVSGNKYTAAFTLEDDATAAINLSEKGTANCYIVNQASKRYKFDCKVRGNGVDPIPTDSEPAEITGYDSAQITWETVNTGTAPITAIISDVVLDKTNGFVCFSTPSTFVEGNALISIKDNAGKIIWSWHIWATQADIEGNAQTYNPDNAGPLMDRNLGALSATPGNPLSIGFYYQGGRPWPITGMYSFSSDDRAVTTNNDIWETVTTTETIGTLEYSSAHPTHFISGSNDNIGYTNDWMWGVDLLYWNASKTMYDPCPVGWKIPDGRDDAEVVTNPWAGVMTNTNFPWTDNGRTLLSPEAYYPLTGYLIDGIVKFRKDKYGMYWTVYDMQASRCRTMLFHNTDIGTKWYFNRKNAAVIRPIKDI